MNNKTAFPVDVDTTKYTLALKIYGRKALPKAVAETLNNTADAVTKQQIKNVKKDLRVRTKYTLNSMQRRGHSINQARGLNVDRMFSRAGTFSRYLWTQEENFTKKGMSGPVPIPTLSARVGKNIQKTIRKQYRLLPAQSLVDGGIDSKTFIGTPRGGSRKRGLYARNKGNKYLVMMRNLEHKEVKIKGKHFHSSALKRYGTQQFIKAQFLKASKKILKQKGIA